jgi:predicted lipoprotein
LKGAAILVIALAGSCALGGCKVVTIDEDRALRARRGGDFDARQYVDTVWASKVVPAINAGAKPAANVMAAVGSDLDKAGAALGRRAGEGSAWTFVLSGEGVVRKVDNASRRGSIDVALSGGASGRMVRIQTGPVVSETAIRDALPFVTFNDFTDQLTFAEVGRALTAKALTGLRPALGQAQPGRHIRFVGVANVRNAADPLVVTPVSISIGDMARAS